VEYILSNPLRNSFLGNLGRRYTVRFSNRHACSLLGVRACAVLGLGSRLLWAVVQEGRLTQGQLRKCVDHLCWRLCVYSCHCRLPTTWPRKRGSEGRPGNMSSIGPAPHDRTRPGAIAAAAGGREQAPLLLPLPPLQLLVRREGERQCQHRQNRQQK